MISPLTRSALLRAASTRVFSLAACSLGILALLAGEPTSAEPATKVGSKPAAQTSNAKDKKMSDIYSFKANTLDGKSVDFSTYKGDVLLIVNTASQCGFTPQYAGLEELHKKYASKGLKVLGFPCNQFGNQEPGDSHAIGAFCQKNYGVDFQMFDKVDVNGANAHPLFKYLTSNAKGALGTESIKWNFTKFLVDREGNVVKRYASTVAPADIAGDIEKQLTQ